MVEIALRKLEFYAYHGVHDHEQINGNNFVVDLLVKGHYPKAVEQDDLLGTVNYEKLYAIVAEEMAVPSQLLEHVAGRIVQRIRTEHLHVAQIRVTIAKLNPPLPGPCQASEVTVSWQKDAQVD